MGSSIALSCFGLLVVWPPLMVNGFDLLVHYNMSEYWQMPALFEYESFESCLRSNPDGIFCVVKSVVKADHRSQIWRTIEKYSRYPYQYHHNVLTRGICLERCEEVVNALSEQQRLRFLEPKFPVDFKYIINDWLLPNIESYRDQYGSLVNICQNYRLFSSYNLTAYTEIEHCTTNNSLHRETDFWDRFFFGTVVLIIIIAIASTIYDAKLAGEEDENHYRSPLQNKSNTLLTAFSLRRNVNRLTMKLKTDKVQQDFRFLEAIRVFILTTITFSHVVIGLGMTTTQNPEMLERMLSRPGLQMFLSMVPFQVDMFFAISGLLLTVHFMRTTESKRFNFKPLWMGVANRYLRSLPVYGMVMVFAVSVFDRLQISPSAYKIMPMVRTICRKKWWMNLLFINNYYKPEEQCLIHTWYLAADFQLFIVGLVVLMILWKYPTILRQVVVLLLAAGFLLPVLNIYFNSGDAIMLLTNKGNAFQLWYDKWFTRTYQATETHCISYFGGMLVGIIYHKMQSDDLLLAKSKLYKTLQYIVFPLTVAFCLPAPLFHLYSFSKPSVWMSLYAGIQRLVIAAFVNTTFLVLMFAERDSFFGRLRSSKLLENAFYRVLGRLGFGFYLIHMTVLKTVYGNQHEALRGSMGLVITVFCSGTMITYVLAAFVYILVEKPFDVILKQLFGTGNTKRQEREVSTITLDNSLNRIERLGSGKRRNSTTLPAH
ncbi:nose resistant to fluoxetine protein 6-like [Toxorhynchites rutilus septentrionalis]|uniref:nose resistant to fluoxetine protein 6-like n=1 Tax=Toxorhynchites rutilus septentrionalis TaxID=329112 RepID=UPI0024797BCA|nr:nose resistant to fluoxetine protein 6-like [Toxorhynchites rutilus septentrionalis]